MLSPGETPGPGIERYLAPDSLEEAVRALAEGEATLLAGGTDLLPQTSLGTLAFKPTLMNIRRLPELAGIDVARGRIRIGATATVAEVLESALLAETAPVLLRAADCFASDQLRNMSTIGGNLCNASPAGDMIIPLLVLDAAVELAAWTGSDLKYRSLALKDFFVAPGVCRRAPHEILTAVRFEVPRPGFVAGFEKFGPRPALEVALVSVGIGGVREGGALTGARVAFGSVAPTPIRAPRAEAALEGRPLDEDTFAAVARAAQDEVSPISDLRASAWYRGTLVAALTQRLLAHVADM